MRKFGEINANEVLDIGCVQGLGDTLNDNRLPTGFIGMWKGTDLPSGWVMCDGKNGTPDLTDRGFRLGKVTVSFIQKT